MNAACCKINPIIRFFTKLLAENFRTWGLKRLGSLMIIQYHKSIAETSEKDLLEKRNSNNSGNDFCPGKSSIKNECFSIKIVSVTCCIGIGIL